MGLKLLLHTSMHTHTTVFSLSPPVKTSRSQPIKSTAYPPSNRPINWGISVCMFGYLSFLRFSPHPLIRSTSHWPGVLPSAVSTHTHAYSAVTPSVCLIVLQLYRQPFIRSTSHFAGVLLRTQGSAVSSMKLFGWVVLQRAASYNTRAEATGPVLNGHCTCGSQWERTDRDR